MLVVDVKQSELPLTANFLNMNEGKQHTHGTKSLAFTFI